MADPEDILGHNRRAWDRLVDRGNRRTIPVGPEDVASPGSPPGQYIRSFIATRARKPG